LSCSSSPRSSVLKSPALRLIVFPLANRPRLASRGDPWEGIDDEPQSLEPLLALHERDRAAGLMDAPWPPVYPKMEGEPRRVAPSRARKDPEPDED